MSFLVMTLAGGIAYFAAVWFTAESAHPGLNTALLMVPLLLVISLPVLAHTASRLEIPGLFVLLVVGLLARFAAVPVKIAVARDLYGSLSDAQQYHDQGNQLAAAWRHGNLTFAPVAEVTQPGTRATSILTGAVSYVVGPSVSAQYLMFAWIGFWGIFLFFLAFRCAFPAAPVRIFGCAVFLLPSLVFWPSGVGKEAPMIFLLGLAALGSARLFAGRAGALPCLAGALIGMALLRPHVAALLFAAVGTAFVLRGDGAGRALGQAPRKVLVGLLMLAAAVGLYSRLGAFFQTGQLNLASANSVLQDLQTNNAGDADFSAPASLSPVNLPWGVITVLFRPFPHEAQNLVMLGSALEGLLLLALTLRIVQRRSQVWATLRTNPFAAACAIYSLLFCLVFGAITNFGLLARQRIQLLPFLLVLIVATSTPVRRRVAALAPTRR